MTSDSIFLAYIFRRLRYYCFIDGFCCENELHNEGGSSDQCVAEHHVGADEDAVWVFGNHRRIKIISTRVSLTKCFLNLSVHLNAGTDLWFSKQSASLLKVRPC